MVVAGLLLSGGVLKTLAIFSARDEPEAGLTDDGRLRPCPDRPNCVNSEDPDPLRRVEALPCEDEGDWARLREVLGDVPRLEIVTEGEGYLHATVRSGLFGFVDDVEFRLDADGAVIHVRSGSRVGRSDLGVNRRRAAKILELWRRRNHSDAG